MKAFPNKKIRRFNSKMRQSFKDSSKTVSKRFRSREKSRKKFGFGSTKITESTETVSSALRIG